MDLGGITLKQEAQQHEPDQEQPASPPPRIGLC
jgi:hypothetical protein